MKMDKSLILLIRMCEKDKESFSASELAALLSLKYIEGVYPHIRKLLNEQLIAKEGGYWLNPNQGKVQTIRFLLPIYGGYTEDLLSVHTKRILERFAKKPLLKGSELPYHNLRRIREIAEKSRIIHLTKEGSADLYFIRSWEEPVRKILSFFDIRLDFDEEEYRHYIIKTYSSFASTQTHLATEQDAELAKANMTYYLHGGDLILDKLRNATHPELAVLDILTREKLKTFTNPFEITRKINDWKIKYVYNTDRIEGNPLTYEEVRSALTIGTEGIRREKKDILETVNSRTALDNIFDTTNELTEEFIRRLHRSVQQGISQGAGEWKTKDNCIVDSAGTLIDTTTPARFAGERMADLVTWYGREKARHHPLSLAAIVHNQFVYIHPFEDGNGRVGRLLFNFILIKNGFFPIVFFNDDKQRYYSALRQCKDGDMKPFIMLCAELYRTQLEMF